MEYVLVYGISILTGLIAHYWKARNGIIWSILTFALMLPLIPFYMMGGKVLVSWGAVGVGIIVFGCMSFLPKTKACPYCKRRVHEEATVCSYCRSNLVLETNTSEG